MNDAMPAAASYRGARIHRFQDEARVREIVAPEIDHVLDDLSSGDELVAFLADLSKSPEARLVAARRLLEWAESAEHGRRRAPVDREQIEALTAGLDAIRWADPAAYSSMLLVPKAGEPRPAPRPAEHRAALEAAAAGK